MKFNFSKITDYRLHNFSSIKVIVKFVRQRWFIFRKPIACYVTVETVDNIVLLKQKVKAKACLEFLKGLEGALKSKRFKCMDFDWLYNSKNLDSLYTRLGQKCFVFTYGK